MKICSTCQTSETSRWWGNLTCNRCALRKKRRKNGVKARNLNFDKQEYKKKHYQDNKEKYRLKHREFCKLNKEKDLEYKRIYNKTENGRAVKRAALARYRAKLRNASPTWSNKEKILEIYKNCPEGHEVDHIIPISSALVCGLHVDYNLQYLPASENRKKSNKLI